MARFVFIAETQGECKEKTQKRIKIARIELAQKLQLRKRLKAVTWSHMFLKLRTLACVGFLASTVCVAQGFQQGSSFVVSCDEAVAIVDRSIGVSGIDLNSNQTIWQAMRNKIVDVGPVVAADTVAVITDSFNTIYGFSRRTGKQLWKKDLSTTVLASDEQYFYTIRVGTSIVFALDPRSGAVVWSLRLSDLGPGYLRNLPIHNGLLFVGDSVVDISKRAIIRNWSEQPFYTETLGFDDDGWILSAGPRGVIIVYDKDLSPLIKLSAGKGEVVEVASVGKQILALVERYDSAFDQSWLVLLTREGRELWRIRWPAKSQGFAIVGSNVLTLEPGPTPGKPRLVARQLSDGAVKWTTKYRYFGGPPLVCRHTAYVEDGDRVRGFDLQSGKETARQKAR